MFHGTILIRIGLLLHHAASVWDDGTRGSTNTGPTLTSESSVHCSIRKYMEIGYTNTLQVPRMCSSVWQCKRWEKKEKTKTMITVSQLHGRAEIRIFCLFVSFLFSLLPTTRSDVPFNLWKNVLDSWRAVFLFQRYRVCFVFNLCCVYMCVVWLHNPYLCLNECMCWSVCEVTSSTSLCVCVWVWEIKRLVLAAKG